MSKKPLPDNSDYERLRDKYVRELDPHRAAMYLERMLEYVPTARELVQADFDLVLDGGKASRRLPLCCRVTDWLVRFFRQAWCWLRSRLSVQDGDLVMALLGAAWWVVLAIAVVADGLLLLLAIVAGSHG